VFARARHDTRLMRQQRAEILESNAAGKGCEGERGQNNWRNLTLPQPRLSSKYAHATPQRPTVTSHPCATCTGQLL
jgi:hypothetical protein